MSNRASNAIAMDLETVHISPDAEARIIDAVEALEAELEAVKAERDTLLWRVRNEAEGQARIDAEVSK